MKEKKEIKLLCPNCDKKVLVECESWNGGILFITSDEEVCPACGMDLFDTVSFHGQATSDGIVWQFDEGEQCWVDIGTELERFAVPGSELYA